MVDFSSSLYLGILHPAKTLAQWPQLTLGKPSALAEPESQALVAQRLARLTGCRSVLLGSSTLHLFWDVFGFLAKSKVEIFVDSGTYPIARWGVQRAMGLGVTVQHFPHYKPQDLVGKLARVLSHNYRPVVVCDGFCPGCGQPAPLKSYLSIVREFGGYLLIDDTQALGILGRNPDTMRPYGSGGGGSLQWQQSFGPELMVISSLAKGFGAPVAMLGGNDNMISRFDQKSETRMHCSPPSFAAIHAAGHALDYNQREGDALRQRLINNVKIFRDSLATYRLKASGGIFPVQNLHRIPGVRADVLYQKLRSKGIQTVLHHPRDNHPASISFLLSAGHSPGDVQYAIDVIGNAARENKHNVGEYYETQLSIRKRAATVSTGTW